MGQCCQWCCWQTDNQTSHKPIRQKQASTIIPYQQKQLGAKVLEQQELEQSLIQKKQKNQELNNQISKLFGEQQRLNKQLQKLGQRQPPPQWINQTELHQKIQTLNQQIRQKDRQINKLSTQLEGVSNEYNGQIRRAQQFQGTRLQPHFDRSGQQNQKKKENLLILKGQLQKTVAEKESLQIKLEEEKQKNAQAQKSLIDLNNQKIKLSYQIQRLSKEKDNMDKQLQRIEEIKNQNERRIEDLRNEQKQLKNKINQPKSLVPKKSQRNNRQFFQGEVLDNGDEDYRQFMLGVLQQRLGRTIKRTKLVYRYDTINRTNIHKYIDFKANLVLIVKLANGYRLAAWTQGGFKPKTPSEGDGIIFSLTNLKSFEPAKPNSRVVVYDDYFVIFGNSQIRLKTQQDKIFSNFGLNQSYFRFNGEKVDVLLGEGKKREVQLQTYEVFQLIL